MTAYPTWIILFDEEIFQITSAKEGILIIPKFKIRNFDKSLTIILINAKLQASDNIY